MAKSSRARHRTRAVDVLMEAAFTEDPHPCHSEVGATFADALALLKRARYVGLAVEHGAGSKDWSYVRVPRSAMVRWLNDRIASVTAAGARPLHSRLTVRFDEEIWLFVGTPGKTEVTSP